MAHIFVFGSNLAGRHGKGAAFVAKMQYGAIQGKGSGPQGRSYAIPTKDANLKVLNLRMIKKYVDDFVTYAGKNSQHTFMVTAIGTGLAGYSHDDIAPMFYHAPVNCVLPLKWRDYYPVVEGRRFWHS